jgi:hypothetical protein
MATYVQNVIFTLKKITRELTRQTNKQNERHFFYCDNNDAHDK